MQYAFSNQEYSEICNRTLDDPCGLGQAILIIHFEVAVLHPKFNNSLNIFNSGRQYVRKDTGFARGFDVFMAGGLMPPSYDE
jgi:hypothetical protein